MPPPSFRLPFRRLAFPSILTLALFFLYTSNRRHIGGGDVVPATLMPIAMLRGDGPVLDRFDSLLRTPAGAIPGYAEESRGHIVPRYPLGPALVAVPFHAPQLLARDLLDPGWERRDPAAVRLTTQRMGKTASAAIASLATLLTALWLLRLGIDPRSAWPAALLVALGTDQFAMASQALWQHGPAILCLAASLWILSGPAKTSWKLGMAGVLAGLVVACRPVDLIFSLALWIAVLRTRDRHGRWAFTLGAATVALALAAYNLYFFDTLSGGYAAIERMHPWAHGTRGTWTAPFLEGAAGTLFSPSHGLLVYSPWIALVLLALPRAWRALTPTLEPAQRTLAAALLLALVPTFVLLSKYSCWWGGHCYGPRFWIDANPAFALAAALVLEHARHTRKRLLTFTLALLFAASLALQLVGFLCYPTSWHASPTNADLDHPRLWHWRDSEVSRGLREGVKPPAW